MAGIEPSRDRAPHGQQMCSSSSSAPRNNRNLTFARNHSKEGDRDQTYVEMRAMRIERNRQRLLELGLICTELTQPSTPQLRSTKTSANQKKRLSSVPVTTRKSPRLLARIVDLSEDTAQPRVIGRSRTSAVSEAN